MKQSVKHSKIKNTGILFELLTRQVTADILNANEKSSKAVKLVKKYFNEEMDKEPRNKFVNLQGQPFTDTQLRYGAKDVEYLINIKLL